jgi:FHA domain-containing protein
MMSIRVVSRAGEAPVTPLAATFGPAGGDIGRGADCTLVLPDPDRRISRRHAQVDWRDGRAFIRQLGAGVAVELDGLPLGVEREQPLADGSEIRIGHYVLEARLLAAQAFPPFAEPANDEAGSDHVDLPLDAPQPLPAPAELDLVLEDASPAAPAPADLAAALRDGLGIAMPAQPSPEQARLVGALLRASIAGVLGLLAARNVAKRELGAAPTMLQTRENNPLKFSPDADAALRLLLGPAQRGFIAPLDAVNDAFDDLRMHELAVLAGMRAALDAVLSRFDPDALEQQLATSSMWDGLVPAARKARLWERYQQQYAQMLRDIDDDFESLFGRAFLTAYRAQLAEFAEAKSLNPDGPA